MSASVRLSLKAAKALVEVLDGGQGIYGLHHERAEEELKQAIARASRASATRRTLRKPKEAKHKAKREARQEVRALVVARAEGNCEACGHPLVAMPEMDHFWGRARAESLETCWLLDRWCHVQKTRNSPSAARWLTIFADHCLKHGYTEAEARARKRLAFVEARGAP